MLLLRIHLSMTCHTDPPHHLTSSEKCRVHAPLLSSFRGASHLCLSLKRSAVQFEIAVTDMLRSICKISRLVKETERHITLLACRLGGSPPPIHPCPRQTTKGFATPSSQQHFSLLQNLMQSPSHEGLFSTSIDSFFSSPSLSISIRYRSNINSSVSTVRNARSCFCPFRHPGPPSYLR